MKDIFKNPILYYIAVPILVSAWPLLVRGLYLPAAQEQVVEERTQAERGKVIMLNILNLDPERAEIADANDAVAEFTYGGAVDWVANICKIPSNQYNVSSSMIVTANKQKTQSAKVDLKQVGIVKFARFLSMIQLRWANLQCERVKLTKKEGLADNDVWDADIEFKYYY